MANNIKLSINNLRLPLDSSIDDLKKLAAGRIGVDKGQVEYFRIIKESLDARRKPGICRVYSVVIGVCGNNFGRDFSSDGDIKPFIETVDEILIPGTTKLRNRPVIIGSGPAGLFAGLVLAGHGYKPLILERGEGLEARQVIVGRYWSGGVLDAETNVQFGEGGAGTFSDGKLTTRINDRRCDRVLEEFFRLGANEDILYKAKPHIGSDYLKIVVAGIRRKIEALGGEIRFKSKMTSLSMDKSKVTGVVINGDEEIDAEVVVLAVGHSARDTFESLLAGGVVFEQKPFSIGVRIEHPQEMIDRAQYGSAADNGLLGAADYQLFQKIGNRTAYTFCMCPGGLVVASASEQGIIVTNGMSEYARDRKNANSAFVVSVGPGDFKGSHPLAGVEFQREWERQAFSLGGGKGSAPVQLLGDFISGSISKRIGSVQPSYTGEICLADINNCLPSYVSAAMREATGMFDRKLSGFAMKDAVLTGVETRTSSPVRIPRGDTMEVVGIGGLYPAGEGAGYAGGIMSAAVDGMKVAEKIIKTFAQP